MEIYVVQQGDTVWKIARRFGVSVDLLVACNGLSAPGELVVGQALLILFPKTVYTVRRGDSLYSIAKRFDTTVMALLQNNPAILQANYLYPGQVLIISFDVPKADLLTINGYAYPYIDQRVLRSALPYLTWLTIFGYGVSETGDLIEIDDEPLIRTAYEYKVAPVMLLSSITESGDFSSQRASSLFRRPDAQNALIDKILHIMRKKGYLGLDLDFEYVFSADAEAYVAFVERVTKQLNANGFFVNVDLAPKTEAAQKGLLYEGHRYAELGAAANTVLLMTYEWGYTYGPPMAVAPENQVRAVVSYAVTEIPPRKILMGIPNYGYDWMLPYQQGVTRATSIGNDYAVTLAAQNNAEIQYDTTAQSPYFEYRDPVGRQHIVWFEDARSINAKYDLLSSYSLLGAGYWNVMRPFVQNWSLVNARFRLNKIVP